MAVNQVRDAYRQTEGQSRIHPVKLVHLMYSRVLTHLELAEEAILNDEPRKRGENLGKAIAIVAELQASVTPEDTSEAAEFLRGLYGTILLELPKAASTKDVTILRRASTYLAKLKEIWEQEAMGEQSPLDVRLPASDTGHSEEHSEEAEERADYGKTAQPPKERFSVSA